MPQTFENANKIDERAERLKMKGYITDMNYAAVYVGTDEGKPGELISDNDWTYLNLERYKKPLLGKYRMLEEASEELAFDESKKGAAFLLRYGSGKGAETMFFYLCKVAFTEEQQAVMEKKLENINQGRNSRNCSFIRSLRETTEDFNKEKKDKKFFLSGLNDSGCQVCAASIKEPISPEETAGYLDRMDIPPEVEGNFEITVSNFVRMVYRAERNDYISDTDSILKAFKLRDLDRSAFINEIEEGILSKDGIQENRLREDCKEAFSVSLEQEIGRILSSKRQEERLGVPVQYMIETDNSDFEKSALKTLLHALYLRGRIESGRYMVVNQGRLDDSRMEDVYQLSENGCLLIRLNEMEEKSTHIASRDMELIQEGARRMKKYQNSTLTIFLLPKSCNKQRDLIFRKTQGCTFVEITQDLVDRQLARVYLIKRAEEHHAVPDEDLFRKIQEEGKKYSVAELNREFEYWMNRYLKEKVYPEYADLACSVEEDSKKKPVGEAYEQLQKMTGLTEAKEVIREALDYYKAQKLFQDRGFQEEHPVMHMVFTGNPGTAKTTVARLFAEIMKDNGLLSVGNLVEVGRADLVGEYVGQTAPKVRDVFQRAKGSVLFIDEAYSLLENHRGLYGDEALDTIVQEMENLKEDIVVILAGYPEEMEQLLDRNPGLRSRIAYHVPFPDYSSWELYEIAELQAEEKGMHLAADAEKKLIPIFEEVRKTVIQASDEELTEVQAYNILMHELNDGEAYMYHGNYYEMGISMLTVQIIR